MQNAKNAFSTKEHAAVKYVTYLAIVQGTKNPCHSKRAPDAAGECLTQNISHDKWRSDSRRGLSYLPYMGGYFLDLFLCVTKIFLKFYLSFLIFMLRKYAFSAKQTSKGRENLVRHRFLMCFLCVFYVRRGAMTQKTRFLCRNLMTYDDFFFHSAS